MNPYLNDGDIQIYHGDVIDTLRQLPSGIAQTCVTSPPYWGLRDYQTGTWTGGDTDCDHLGETFRTKAKINANCGTGADVKNAVDRQPMGQTCSKCGARREDSQLGLESTPELYVERMVAVFREVWRVLRDDGTVWLNLGDSYAGSWGNQGRKPDRGEQRPINGEMLTPVLDGRYPDKGSNTGAVPPGLKPKDLVGIPWRVAFALQADGWYLRSDIVWSKPNPMPESVSDRPTKAHEYLFLLSKQPRYYMDMDAIREPHEGLWQPEFRRRSSNMKGTGDPVLGTHRNGPEMMPTNPAGRNRRSVWTIPTQPMPEAHFATFPEALVRPCILAGSSERGECSVCGAPWTREVERSGQPPEPEHRHPEKRLEPGQAGNVGNGNMGFRASRLSGQEMAAWKAEHPDVTTGWRASCTCDAPTRPQTVLDPFIGSGTTALVARKHGRRCIGIDLSAEYLEIAARRLQQLSLFAEPA